MSNNTKTNVTATVIRIAVLEAHLQLAELILNSAMPSALHVDAVQAAKIGETVEGVAAVRVWLMTYRETLEAQLID